jgi:hypothetical protein
MVDTAFVDLERQLVVTDPSGFAGLTIGGVFGVHRAEECLGYVTGFVSIGDFFNDGYLPAGASGALLPFPIDQTEPVAFAVPLPCNTPIDVNLLSLDDEVIDSVPFVVPDRAVFAELRKCVTNPVGVERARWHSRCSAAGSEHIARMSPERTPVQLTLRPPSPWRPAGPFATDAA